MPHLTRAQRKALDREIPWREIVRKHPEVKQAFVDAANKEGRNFSKWDPIRPLSLDEIKLVDEI